MIVNTIALIVASGAGEAAASSGDGWALFRITGLIGVIGMVAFMVSDSKKR